MNFNELWVVFSYIITLNLFSFLQLNCHNLISLELDNLKCGRLVLHIEDMQKSLQKLTLLKILNCPLTLPKITQQEMVRQISV